MTKIPSSELIVNPDGSIFHLHLRPEQLADRIVLVGDPGRVETVASRFEAIESRTANREFVSATGVYRGRRLTVLSHGIGTDNIDIVMTELDALANIDLASRTVKPERKKLYLVRLGTSGALQADLRLGDLILAETSVGFDGLLNFYAGRDAVCDLDMESAFVRAMEWDARLASPYFVHSSRLLNDRFRAFTVPGITISAPGFYGPQGRTVRLAPVDGEMNRKLEAFRYNGRRITNYEMESSALAGLAALLGHEATTICTVIAQRIAGESDTDYQPFVQRMIELALNQLVEL
ncbi:MAG: nucleoside phosphorylase [Rikenellaceae bacterium]|jgi:uridine phosphorylase|nr:nucleoside phosphorylase [Rikenellaceae bacterium]